MSHCIGCIGEKKELSQYFQARGFEMFLTCRKIGGIEKAAIDGWYDRIIDDAYRAFR